MSKNLSQSSNKSILHSLAVCKVLLLRKVDNFLSVSF